MEVDGNILYKYGYISENGVWVIPPVFDDTKSGSTTVLQPTSTGYLYTAKKGNKWGFVNSMGNWVIDPIYDYVSDFHADRAYILINGRNAFIDPKGDEIITFNKDIFAEEFCEEISVYYKIESDTYTFIDINGNILFVLDEVQSLISDHYGYYKLCSEGLIQVKKNNKWGFVDKQGEWAIEPRFDAVESFSEGFAAARSDGKWGFIDKNGAWRIYPQFKNVKRFSEGLAAVMSDTKWAFIDKQGNSPFKSQYLFLPITGADNPNDYVFYDGLACAYYADNGIYGGYIDTKGRWAIPPKFRYIMPFINGMAMVDTGDSVGYINRSGKWVTFDSFFIENMQTFNGNK